MGVPESTVVQVTVPESETPEGKGGEVGAATNVGDEDP